MRVPDNDVDLNEFSRDPNDRLLCHGKRCHEEELEELGHGGNLALFPDVTKQITPGSNGLQVRSARVFFLLSRDI